MQRNLFNISVHFAFSRRRKLNEESSANKGFEFNGPYGYTNDVILPKSPDRITPRQPQTSGKEETQTDDIYHDIKEDEQEYAYADVKSNTVPDDTLKLDANGLVVIYAKSENGGSAQDHKSHYPSDSTDYAYACSSEITDQHTDDYYVYATSDSVRMPQRTNEIEANNETEGWEDNGIYATENNVEVKENLEGWEDNSIYADSEKGPEVKGQNDDDEVWKNNVVYGSNRK